MEMPLRHPSSVLPCLTPRSPQPHAPCWVSPGFPSQPCALLWLLGRSLVGAGRMSSLLQPRHPSPFYPPAVDGRPSKGTAGRAGRCLYCSEPQTRILTVH